MSEKSPKSGNTTPDSDPSAPPLAVRWINIGGIDWNVLRAVALKYELHSLALEDILHESGHNHSKADYYPEHLFIRILCHVLADPDDDDFEPYEEPPPLPLEVEVEMPTSPKQAASGEGPPRRTFSVVSDSGLGLRSASTAIASELNTLAKTDPIPASEPDSNPGVKDESDTETPEQPRKSRRRGLVTRARNALRKRFTALSGFPSPARRELIVRIRELKKDFRVNIKHQPLFIFLLRNGTVISIHPSPNLEYSVPIVDRLHQADSVLRESNDASLLVQSLIDLVVDRILEMMDEYQAKIHDLEHQILMNPSMNAVRYLHILSGDLIMHRRTLDPIKTMIFGLRKYDLDRCIALADNLAMAKQQQDALEAKRRHKRRKHGWLPGASTQFTTTGSKVEAFANLEPSHIHDLHRDLREGHIKTDDDHLREFMKQGGPGAISHVEVQGYFSYKAKVYLADVYDHMDFALTSLDMFSGISENLINFAFNMASYEMNTVMSRLTLVSIVFLPLTLLTGYFGMNFQPFWSVDENSDKFFWKVAVPMMACLIPLFMFDELKKFFIYLKRRWQDRQAVRHLLRELRGSNAQAYFDLQA
ncbi:hypothetical protein CC2G_000292 [Coprinopsis cinerea AmutBmut pab1-1]|nr:hypothetical protein CC2G_000292 [Coprinopsis cinerea AmutBmut pab1-1]